MDGMDGHTHTHTRTESDVSGAAGPGRMLKPNTRKPRLFSLMLPHPLLLLLSLFLSLILTVTSNTKHQQTVLTDTHQLDLSHFEQDFVQTSLNRSTSIPIHLESSQSLSSPGAALDAQKPNCSPTTQLAFTLLP
jgi:hypothetical protein